MFGVAESPEPLLTLAAGKNWSPVVRDVDEGVMTSAADKTAGTRRRKKNFMTKLGEEYPGGTNSPE